MQIIFDWAQALRSGLYRDARLYTPKERHQYLKQNVWSVQDGSYVPVYSAIGVLAVLRDCTFFPGSNGVQDCRSMFISRTNISLEDLSDSERSLVEAIQIAYDGRYSFDDLAARLDDHVPLGYRFANVAGALHA